jgi:hypothetical protein
VETCSGKDGVKKLPANAVRTVPRRPNSTKAAASKIPIAKHNRETVRMILLAFSIYRYLTSKTQRQFTPGVKPSVSAAGKEMYQAPKEEMSQTCQIIDDLLRINKVPR